jgi:hypothetical protein
VPPHPATPAKNARRTPVLDEPAAPTKSAAAHPPQSATSTKDDESGARARAAPDEEGADRSIGEPRAVDGGGNGPTPASPQPPHRFLQSAIDGVVLQPPQKTIQRGVVGYRWQVQCGAQLVVIAQAYFGFVKGPVFVAHQALVDPLQRKLCRGCQQSLIVTSSSGCGSFHLAYASCRNYCNEGSPNAVVEENSLSLLQIHLEV